MAQPLQLVHLSQSGRINLGLVQGEEIVLGREPPAGGILLASHAVSRHHGVLRGMGQQWFFLDQESTNGSWLNGQKLKPNEWKLVKPGDYLQLGDIAIEVQRAPGNSAAPIGIRSLIVFSRNILDHEYPVPEFGRALVVGGNKSDLKLTIDVHDLPSLVVERRGDSVAAFTISKEVPVLLNGDELAHTTVLSDRDELEIDHYRIIYNDISVGSAAPSVGFTKPPIPPEMIAASAKGKPTLEYEASGLEAEPEPIPEPGAPTRDPARSFPWAKDAATEHEPQYSAAARSPERSVFGKVHGGSVDETVAMEPGSVKSKVVGYDIHPGMRYAINETEEDVLSSLEDKVWLLLGLVMVLALIGMVLWWVLAKP